MKKLLITTFIICGVLAQQVYAEEDKNTLCFDIPETLEKDYSCPQEVLRTIKDEEEIGFGASIPLYKCFTNWRALKKSPAPILAAALALLKLTMGGLELYKGIKTNWQGENQLDTAILFVESIVFGYLANWFIKDFIQSCKRQHVYQPNRSKAAEAISEPKP